MQTSLIVAVSNNGVIGLNNDLPWRLPEDLKHFKRVTLGKPVIMGRKTYDSIGKPLPGRLNIVITRQAQWQAEGVVVAHSLEQALAIARQGNHPDLPESSGANCVDEAVIIGGAAIYAESLPLVTRIYLTLVHQDFEGDTFFPAIDPDQWKTLSAERVSGLNMNTPDFTIKVLERNK